GARRRTVCAAIAGQARVRARPALSSRRDRVRILQAGRGRREQFRLRPHGHDAGPLRSGDPDGLDRPVLPLTVALIALFAIAVATGRAKVHPRMRMVLALFAAATLLAPEWALGGWGVHLRLPAVLGALAFASLEWKVSPRIIAAGAAIALLFLAAGAGVLAWDWKRYDAQYAEFRAHDAAIAADSRVLTVLDGDSLGWAADQPYWHMAEFATIDRGAFTPLMFTTAGQHVIHIRAPYGAIAASTAQQGSPPDIDELAD